MADLFGHEAAPIRPGSVEVVCELRMEKPEAIAVVNGTRELGLGDGRETWIWLPLSQVDRIAHEPGNIIVLTIPERLAREKGLI